MLVARKHREDPTERKLCRVKVLAGGALLVDDDQDTGIRRPYA